MRKTMIKNKYSILSVDSNPDYLFFVPITCAFWKEIGYQPFVILVDTGIDPEIRQLVFDHTARVGGHIKVLEHIEGYRTCNVAQISRLYAAADPYFKDDDYLMTDDMDKFVVDYMWFNQQNKNKDIHIYDPDELNYKRLKIGNIGMKSAIWKEVIGIKDGSIRENLLNCFDENLSKNSDWNTGWNLDEWILTKSVFESRFYPDNCQNFVRGANRWGIRNGRIDRGAWTQTFNQCMSTKIIDVHLHRDPYVGQIWEDTVTIMRRVFPKNKVEEFINYKQEFVKRLKT
tara:strand:- start:1764 stop:2621 length:858 start_codon:yes stop_codon:yes gene_type:complete